MTSESPKVEWAGGLPGGLASRDDLAHLVDSDGGRDSVENDLFEAANDPQAVHQEAVQRRFKSQLRRRLRHMESKSRRD